MKTVINIKTDKEVKENAQQLAAKLGLSLSHVVNASLRNFISTRKVVFSDIPQMTPEFEKKIAKIEKDLREGKSLSPSFAKMKDAIDYLDSL